MLIETTHDYLGSTVRGFSSGSVVVNFSTLIASNSSVTEGDLETLTTTVFEESGGSLAGTDIQVDPTAIAFKRMWTCLLSVR